jgi:hypothetical protein
MMLWGGKACELDASGTMLPLQRIAHEVVGSRLAQYPFAAAYSLKTRNEAVCLTDASWS